MNTYRIPKNDYGILSKMAPKSQVANDLIDAAVRVKMAYMICEIEG